MKSVVYYCLIKHELIGSDKNVFLIFCFSVYKPWELCREVFTDNLRPSVPTKQSINNPTKKPFCKRKMAPSWEKLPKPILTGKICP